MRQPPYAWKFLPVPHSGVRVAIGQDASDRALRHQFPIMVLPLKANPFHYKWPANGDGALLFEWGPPDDRAVRNMSACLLNAGSPFVVAIRDCNLDSGSPSEFYYPEVLDVAA